jgi:hypothetical protein
VDKVSVDMKKISSLVPSIPVLVMAFCALLVASAPQCRSAGEAGGGRVVIRRSPTLGSNVVVAITIDGKPAGSITRGRTLETSLTAGSHTLSASSGSGENPWRGTVNVRAGETYTYTASYTVNQISLTPAAPSR